ncbi:MAG: glycerol-3-phosphate 1-O-acyltransferase PlsY [Candidatus Zixiibacteriota bacterium]
MSTVIVILGAYLIGTIPYGLLIPKFFGIADIRQHGSGNVGATNAWRVAGPLAGLIVTFFDICKGVVAVLLAGLVANGPLSPELLRLLSGFSAIIGHIFPFYLNFRGGKGVNTALGVMITLLPLEALAGLGVFIIIVTITKYISFGSLLAAMTFFLTVLVRWYFKWSDINIAYVITAGLLNILIIIAHRSNIKRLLKGNENKFSLHSKKADEKEVRQHV